MYTSHSSHKLAVLVYLLFRPHARLKSSETLWIHTSPLSLVLPTTASNSPLFRLPG